jgi:ankyrin repeat protein
MSNLHIAASIGDVVHVQTLPVSSADIEELDEHGVTALMLAACCKTTTDINIG